MLLMLTCNATGDPSSYMEVCVRNKLPFRALDGLWGLENAVIKPPIVSVKPCMLVMPAAGY